MGLYESSPLLQLELYLLLLLLLLLLFCLFFFLLRHVPLGSRLRLSLLWLQKFACWPAPQINCYSRSNLNSPVNFISYLVIGNLTMMETDCYSVSHIQRPIDDRFKFCKKHKY
jgi:hypothetical protein